MSDVKVLPRAYTKMILHAAKYPHCSINGILLSDRDSTKSKNTIVDVMPLFHQCLHVTPMAEIALVQIEAIAAERNVQIAGYYAATENFYENSIEKMPGTKVAEKIAELVPGAVFIVIDNQSMGLIMERPAIKVWQNIESRWTKTTFSLDQSRKTLETVSALVQRGAMKDLYDFDNHLDNIENDWINEHLNRDLQQLLAMY